MGTLPPSRKLVQGVLGQDTGPGQTGSPQLQDGGLTQFCLGIYGRRMHAGRYLYRGYYQQGGGREEELPIDTPRPQPPLWRQSCVSCCPVPTG